MSRSAGHRLSAALLVVGMSALTGACAGPPTSPTAEPTGLTTGLTTEPTPDPGASSPSEVAGSATTQRPSPPTPSTPPSTHPAPEEASRTGAPSPCESEALIEAAAWIELDGRSSLEVRPTEVLRQCGLHGASEKAWPEVLELIPDADTDGMREQFTCHVLFAPTKDVWHLEPWRPVVDGPQLLAARCNPGGADPDLG
ncbi:DUF2599 domain-containing protein [Ornithinimicrobium cryptoxanthini]|uniref:DUF2599 domain-containing protein n=1 Tax=Ornithinimicrobium cryptoxanthini TaxID=2934161 RepID=UPI0021199137|nr:DUF2599 domain-containing protein [Ornithinimicrobium cryptoxanthini]